MCDIPFRRDKFCFDSPGVARQLGTCVGNFDAPIAAEKQWLPQGGLKFRYSRRQGGLGNIAGLRGSRKIPFVYDGQKVAQMVAVNHRFHL